MSIPPPTSSLRPNADPAKSEFRLAPTEYRVHPSTFWRCKCICGDPPNHLKTAQDFIQYQLFSLDTLWKSLTAIPLPRKVRDAGERVCRQLRAIGYEVAHLAARVLQVQDGRKRGEISVIWLVPAPDEDIGHRVVAELYTQIFAHGAKAGQVENTAVRFATDWGDWTIARPDEYLRAAGSETINFPTEGQHKKIWKDAGIWTEVLRMLAGECEVYMPDITWSACRAVTELELEGNIVSRCEVEKVLRRPIGGVDVYPAIRIALHLKDGEVGAILLLETGGKPGQRKIEGIAVAYSGDWPIVHHYRTVIPPPDLEGFARLMEV